MPVVAVPLDELSAGLGRELPAEQLEGELHRFGCSVEGWATVRRWRCAGCGALAESVDGEELPPPDCDACGADLRAGGRPPAFVGEVRALRMELLPVRPDLFHPAGLARGLAGFLGLAAGAPVYRVSPGEWSIVVDPALSGPEVVRPRIVAATVHGLTLDDGRLRSLMKLQETVHWALGRDRKLASIGVYDLDAVAGPRLQYRAVGLEDVRFTPLGCFGGGPAAALTPGEILAQHPKGRAFAWLLAGARRVPLLEDAQGGVLSLPPIINSEATRVTARTRDILVDVTGLDDRCIDRALAIVVTALLESCPGATARSLEIQHPQTTRRTPDLTPQELLLDPGETARLIGAPWTSEDIVRLLGRMRHDARIEGERVRVLVPAWRADILHWRDLAEDAAIAHGYDRLPAAAIAGATFGAPLPRETLAGRIRAALAGQGFLEVLTLALTSEIAAYHDCGLPNDERTVRLENPVSVEQTILRPSLIPGLMDTLALNLTHPHPQRIFEVGLVSRLDDAAPTGASERLNAAFALAGDGEGYAAARAALDALLKEMDAGNGERCEFLPASAALFLPGRGAEVWRGGRRVGWVGEVHPAVLERRRLIHPVALAEIDVEP